MMIRVEFLEKLSYQLRRFSEEDQKRLISYYDEMIQDRIEDGMDEEKAVASIGSVEKAVEEAMYDVSLPTLVKAKVKESKEKAPNKAVWVTLAILGFPIWLPLLMTLSVVVLCVYVSIWITIISLYVVELSLAAATIFGLISGFIYMFTVSVPAGFFVIGISLVAGALSILFFKPLLFLSKELIQATVLFARKLKSFFISKEAGK